MFLIHLLWSNIIIEKSFVYFFSLLRIQALKPLPLPLHAFAAALNFALWLILIGLYIPGMLEQSLFETLDLWHLPEVLSFEVMVDFHLKL